MADNKRNHQEIRVRGVSQKLVDELNNISDNAGVPLSNILKPKLHEIANSYPAEMKLPKKED